MLDEVKITLISLGKLGKAPVELHIFTHKYSFVITFEFFKNGFPEKIIEGDHVKITPNNWIFNNGSVKTFSKSGEFLNYDFFDRAEFSFPEAAEYFQKGSKKTEEMNIFDLLRDIEQNKARGESIIKEKVEYYWHLGYPFICFFVVFLGGFIGSFLEKGAMAQSMGIAVTISVIYYFIMFFGKAAGVSGSLPAPVAGWLANIIFSGISLGFLFWSKK